MKGLVALSFMLLVSLHNSQQPCSTCSECTTANISSICNCDQECLVFHDCCNSVPHPDCPQPTPGLLEHDASIECHSLFASLSNVSILNTDTPVWMVTSCPQASRRALADNCVNPDSNLPPVTDRDTGLVYRNEHCAICNEVTSLLAWQVGIICRKEVYVMLLQKSLEAILQSDPTIFITECQDCIYLRPQQLADISPPRPCTASISSCLSKHALEDMNKIPIPDENYAVMLRECRVRPIDLVSVENTVYRNTACALCNGVNNPSCYRNEHDPTMIPQCSLPGGALPGRAPPGGFGLSFTITLINLDNGQVRVTAGSQSVNAFVNCSEGEAPVGLVCRPTQCPEGYLETGGRCGFEEGDNSSTTPPAIDCPTALLPLNRSEFEDRGNNTIFFEGEIFNVEFYDSNGRPLVCPDNTSLVTINTTTISLLPGIAELTYIGCSLSFLGTSLVLITYGLFPELRTLPSMLLMNLALAIFSSNILFIVGGPVVQHFSRVDLCISAAICLHYFFLAQFVWMSLFSFEMTHSFYQAKKMVAVTNRKKSRILLAYMLIGWGVPLGISVTTIALNYSGHGLVLYGVTSNDSVGNCWINHYLSLIISFVVPLCLSQAINLILLVVTTTLLCQSIKNKSTQHKTDYMTLMRVWLAVFSITGLTWIFGFLAILDETSALWYPFVIFNTSQGFSIFFAFLCTKKIFKLYRTLLKGKVVTAITGTRKRETSASTVRSGPVLQEEGFALQDQGSVLKATLQSPLKKQELATRSTRLMELRPPWVSDK